MGDDNFEHLERLVAELDARGMLARVVRTQGRLFVRVINPNATSLSENVTCRPANVSDIPDWWYCWSWGERMHTADDPAGAATKVARVLAAVGE
ncbi:hypothetical protein [Nonomuraea jiangxiensis]|uniref:Uncharacterized protein n=1 Tax=Nonomuraea jiangxiensis TaxID=633440 RepID=A0A1G9FSP3_9ACTN|nr:hypothetical protein [Nonomuraea jiangxiensis]SDK91362.1 hypothetical protein SAMN05421869_12062 [Nonomuraea jiangxiensis]